MAIDGCVMRAEDKTAKEMTPKTTDERLATQIKLQEDNAKELQAIKDFLKGNPLFEKAVNYLLNRY
jgi:hypothetical protein